jgi:hypothetical protein
MDYSETTLSKYKTEEDVLKAKEDAKPALKEEEKVPSVTKTKVDALWDYLPWLGKSTYPTDKAEYTSIAAAVEASGLTQDQVQELCGEFNSVQEEEVEVTVK